jgi:trimeric autotransporter adhesin
MLFSFKKSVFGQHHFIHKSIYRLDIVLMADNSLAKAQSLGVLDGNSVIKRDALSKRDRVDYFKFTLNRSSNAKFKLAGLSANADLALLDNTGKAIERSNKGGNKPEKLQRQLAAGTYYLQVKGQGGATGYKLKSSAVAAGSGGTSPGTGTADNPIDLGILTGGPVGRSRETAGDFKSPRVYKFKLAQITDISAALSQVSGSGRLEIFYDANGNGRLDADQLIGVESDKSVAFGSASTSANDPISSVVLPAIGTYFVQVERDLSSSNIQYDLNLTANPIFPSNLAIDPGSEPTTAYNLGTLSKGGSFEAKDYVGGLDATDVFRFTLSEAAKVTFGKVEFGDINITTRVYQDKNNNNILDSSDAIGEYFAGQTSQNLAAGTYFVSASQNFSLYNSAYTLTFSAS